MQVNQILSKASSLCEGRGLCGDLELRLFLLVSRGRIVIDIVESELLNNESTGGTTTITNRSDTLLTGLESVQESDEDTGAGRSDGLLKLRVSVSPLSDDNAASIAG